MLYKVTPAMQPVEEKKLARQPGQARPRRKTAIYDGEGNEVLVTLMCLKCRKVKPLAQFGLRKMADGAIRNQPWCRPCRSAASSKKPKEGAEAASPVVEAPEAEATPEAAAHSPAESAEVTVENDDGQVDPEGNATVGSTP